jgi:YegS/Rv2252/BmrU family lipid kinase
VVAAGGDGTINEVINGLASRPHDAAPPALGVIPLGTANVMARELALPSDVRALARLLAHGGSLPLHTGIANGRRFALMVGVGFDARVVHRIDARLKRSIGRGAYGLAILRELIDFAPVRYRVIVDGGRPIDAAAVIVAKSRHYGGPFELAADASVHEPTLHVCLFLQGGRWSAMRYLAAIGLGRIAQADGFLVISASQVAISGPAGEPAQGDGDSLTTLPLEIALARQPLAVITSPP